MRGDAKTRANVQAVAALTAQAWKDHPAVLGWAMESAVWLLDAIEGMFEDAGLDALAVVVAVHQYLTSTHLADLPDRDAVADHVITAAVFTAADVGDLAAFVSVRQVAAEQAAELPDWASRYRVAANFGDRLIDRPVPRAALALYAAWPPKAAE